MDKLQKKFPRVESGVIAMIYQSCDENGEFIS